MSPKAFAQIHRICQLCLFVDQELLLMISHALFTSQLDICNVLYMGLSLKSIQKLQWIQNAMTWTVLGTSQYDQKTPLLCELHYFSVGFQGQFHVLVATYKVLWGHLSPVASEPPTRSSRVSML